MSKRHIYGQLVVANGSGRMIISPDRVPCIAETYGDDSEEHARRLVACWNACDGTSTDALETEGSAVIGWTRTASKLIHATEQRDHFRGLAQQNGAVIIKTACELADVKAQRDELLAALERIAGLSISMFSKIDDMAVEGPRIALAAIAKAEGK